MKIEFSDKHIATLHAFAFPFALYWLGGGEWARLPQLAATLWLAWVLALAIWYGPWWEE